MGTCGPGGIWVSVLVASVLDQWGLALGVLVYQALSLQKANGKKNGEAGKELNIQRSCPGGRDQGPQACLRALTCVSGLNGEGQSRLKQPLSLWAVDLHLGWFCKVLGRYCCLCDRLLQ